jgi:hypothetical protein
MGKGWWTTRRLELDREDPSPDQAPTVARRTTIPPRLPISMLP